MKEQAATAVHLTQTIAAPPTNMMQFTPTVQHPMPYNPVTVGQTSHTKIIIQTHMTNSNAWTKTFQKLMKTI